MTTGLEKTRRREDESPLSPSLRVAGVVASIAPRLAALSSPANEARDLVAAVLDVPRSWPSLNASRELSPGDVRRIEEAAARLARGMPLAYAARRAQFRHLSLYVDERVLIPRPETELLVDMVLRATGGGRGTVIDVGTGSGALALSLATEGRFGRVIATDVSADALAVAATNARAIAPGTELRIGSYLAPCYRDEANVVVANPPYIAWAEARELPSLVRDWEPAVALFAEDDGMVAIRTIARDAAPVLVGGGLLALEVDTRRADRAAAEVSAVGVYENVQVRNDLTNRARFVIARRA